MREIEIEKMPLLDNEEEFPAMPQLNPGMRSTKLTDSQKTYLIRMGPNQPILRMYPSNTNTSKEGHKLSRFNPCWFEEYPHLEYSLSKDAAFCFVCSLFENGPRMEESRKCLE